jgi:hypothetical protein
MSPKEKAISLVDKFLDLDNYNNLNLDLFCDECGMSNEAAKICALIAVDEIIHEVYDDLEWWKEVKNEIEKL